MWIGPDRKKIDLKTAVSSVSPSQHHSFFTMRGVIIFFMQTFSLWNVTYLRPSIWWPSLIKWNVTLALLLCCVLEIKVCMGKNGDRHYSWNWYFCDTNDLPQCLVAYSVVILLLISIRSLFSELLVRFCAFLGEEAAGHMLPGESHVLLIKLGRYVIAGVFPVKAPSHWLVHGHMTSNNETVSRQKMSGQHCKNYDVKREL